MISDHFQELFLKHPLAVMPICLTMYRTIRGAWDLLTLKAPYFILPTKFGLRMTQFIEVLTDGGVQWSRKFGDGGIGRNADPPVNTIDVSVDAKRISSEWLQMPTIEHQTLSRKLSTRSSRRYLVLNTRWKISC